MSPIFPDKHTFKVGQRVRPSQYGKDRCIFPKTRWEQTGVVLKVDRFNTPTVLWYGRKTPKSYHPSFIEPDRRRKPTPASAGARQ